MHKELLQKHSSAIEKIITKLEYALEEIKEIRDEVDFELSKLPDNEEIF